MKKEKYIAPELEVVKFDEEDVITASVPSKNDKIVNYPVITVY